MVPVAVSSSLALTKCSYLTVLAAELLCLIIGSTLDKILLLANSSRGIFLKEISRGSRKKSLSHRHELGSSIR